MISSKPLVRRCGRSFLLSETPKVIGYSLVCDFVPYNLQNISQLTIKTKPVERLYHWGWLTGVAITTMSYILSNIGEPIKGRPLRPGKLGKPCKLVLTYLFCV